MRRPGIKKDRGTHVGASRKMPAPASKARRIKFPGLGAGLLGLAAGALGLVFAAVFLAIKSLLGERELILVVARFQRAGCFFSRAR
jgi:hypothetical protein